MSRARRMVQRRFEQCLEPCLKPPCGEAELSNPGTTTNHPAEGEEAAKHSREGQPRPPPDAPPRRRDQSATLHVSSSTGGYPSTRSGRGARYCSGRGENVSMALEFTPSPFALTDPFMASVVASHLLPTRKSLTNNLRQRIVSLLPRLCALPGTNDPPRGEPTPCTAR